MTAARLKAVATSEVGPIEREIAGTGILAR